MKKEDNSFKSLNKEDDLKQYLPVTVLAIKDDWRLLCKRCTQKTLNLKHLSCTSLTIPQLSEI